MERKSWHGWDAPDVDYLFLRRISSRPVEYAQFNHTGSMLAVVAPDFSLTVWDCTSAVVEAWTWTMDSSDASVHEGKGKNKPSVYLDWTASDTYICLIIDCRGYVIHSGTGLVSKTIDFDHAINSFACHPTDDGLCIVTCVSQLTELDLANQSKRNIYDFRVLCDADETRLASLASFATYADADGRVLLWIQGLLVLISRGGQVVCRLNLKSSNPMRWRIAVDGPSQTCLLSTRGEMRIIALPELRELSSFRDTVNDSPWRSVALNRGGSVAVAIPENSVVGGPVFYVLHPVRRREGEPSQQGEDGEDEVDGEVDDEVEKEMDEGEGKGKGTDQEDTQGDTNREAEPKREDGLDDRDIRGDGDGRSDAGVGVGGSQGGKNEVEDGGSGRSGHSGDDKDGGDGGDGGDDGDERTIVKVEAGARSGALLEAGDARRDRTPRRDKDRDRDRDRGRIRGEVRMGIHSSSELKEGLRWAVVPPSGEYLLLYTAGEELVMFLRKDLVSRWPGPMYPLHFTHITSNEYGHEKLPDGFEDHFFPTVRDEPDPSATVDVLVTQPGDPREVAPHFAVVLEPREKEEQYHNQGDQLPHALDDIYNP